MERNQAMNMISRGLDYMRRIHRLHPTNAIHLSRAANAAYAEVNISQGMDRFPDPTPAQLMETATRIMDRDYVLSAVCSVIRQQKALAINNIIQAHRRNLTDSQLRTTVGELVGVNNVEETLMAYIDRGRKEVRRRERVATEQAEVK
jgi:hypothetical protein